MGRRDRVQSGLGLLVGAVVAEQDLENLGPQAKADRGRDLLRPDI